MACLFVAIIWGLISQESLGFMLSNLIRRHKQSVPDTKQRRQQTKCKGESSSYDSKAKQRSRPFLLVGIFVLGFFVCGISIGRQWFRLPDSTPKTAIELQEDATSTFVDKKHSNAVSPFTSIPPESIALSAEDPRHACIAKMRNRHDDALYHYLSRADHLLLVDPAYHSNVGDHMITLGELQFLKPIMAEHDIQLSQCSYIQAGEYVPPCESEIPRLAKLHQHPVAIWHGGGNWGDLWRRAQEPRIASFALLASHGYTILTMPNSWFYKDTMLEQQDVEEIRNTFKLGLEQSGEKDSKRRFVFCWREEFSFRKGHELLPFATNLLVPDIAFQLGPYTPIRSRNDPMVDIILLLRDDHESVIAQRSRAEVRSLLNNLPNSHDVSFSIVDWNDRLSRFDSKDIFFTSTAIQLLSLGRIVVCDRLHAAILAYLIGVPFLYMDQVSGKITKTLTASMSGCADETQLDWERASNLTVALATALDWLSKLEPKVSQSRSAKRERLRREKRKQAG